MKTRVLTAVVMVAVMVPFFVFSDTVAFTLLIACLAAVGVFEMQRCIGAERFYPTLLPLLAVSPGMPFLLRQLGEGALGWAFLLSFSLITYTFAAAVFSKSRLSVEQAGLSSVTTIYIAFGFSSILLLRDLPHGEYIYFLAFIIPWVTDTFAYFCGCAFGKHKLIPDVSPKKTVEGSVGGTVSAVGVTLLYGLLIGSLTESQPNWLGIAVVAGVVSLLSQCGDLIMSLIKRKFGIKDYGRIFPGHGGVLDRFDSILCTAPFLYFLTSCVPALRLFT